MTPPYRTMAAAMCPDGKLDVLGNDGHHVRVDREDPTVDGHGAALALERLDGHLTLDEDAEQRRVAGQDAQLARDGPSAYELGLALPDLAVGGNHLNLERTHVSSGSWGCALQFSASGRMLRTRGGMGHPHRFPTLHRSHHR